MKLLCAYDLAAVGELEFSVSLITEELEERNEQERFRLWAALFPMMCAGFVPFVPYNEFAREKAEKRAGRINEEQAKAELLAVVAQYERKNN